MIAPISTKFTYGKNEVTIKSGHIAVHSLASVWLTMGDCVIMVNVCHSANTDQSRDFFPLSVHYSEKFYADGKIPRGFTRREGRPNEREVIICRLIDRSIRPMFPSDFRDEVQITATLLQHDKTVEPDIAAMLATSAALILSGLPYTPIASARVGHVGQKFLLNPVLTENPDSRLDLILSGTEDSCIMVESGSMELPEQTILEGIEFGHNELKNALTALLELKSNAKTFEQSSETQDDGSRKKISDIIQKKYMNEIETCMSIHNKRERNTSKHAMREKIVPLITKSVAKSYPDLDEQIIYDCIGAAEKQWVREQILDKKPRIDGRSYDQIRQITTEVSILPKGPHGSALFTRGETQALATVTLGSDGDAQLLDEATSNSKDGFMLQYNFPPYSVGECGMPSSPKRREIGHGKLARKAISAVLPNTNDSFPYTLRLVSEVLASNGSSSMATVCGGSLALMDAGVPIKDPVAGIAMGLVVDANTERHTVLSDILGDEDHLGDMDFKVAGTVHGITALQMDLKIKSLPSSVFSEALEQARKGRLHILEEMNKTLSRPRKQLAEHAPQMIQFPINPSKISTVIGRGGATIRELIETYGVTIDIADDGVIKIAGENASAIDKARKHIERLTLDLKVGQTYEGKIVKLMDFGAFVNISPGKDGFLHISQISDKRVHNITDELSEGQIVRVQVIEIDEKQQRVKVSMKNVSQTPGSKPASTDDDQD